MNIALRASVLSACVSALLAPPLGADEIPDGIYRVVAEGKGQVVERSVGGKVSLGERLSDQFGEITAWSVSNQNNRSRFQLSKAGPCDTRSRLAIRVGGVTEVVSAYNEPDEEGKVRLLVDVYGEANITRAARRLKVDVKKREHPGHQLMVKWRPLKDRYTLAEAKKSVMVELTIKNVGKTTVRFIEGGQQRGPRDNQFGFTAFSGSGFGKALPDVGDPQNFGGLGAFRTLEPNDVFRKKVDLNKWFRFTKPDSYEITGYYELELSDKEFTGRVLWEEFATGRCYVRVVK